MVSRRIRARVAALIALGLLAGCSSGEKAQTPYESAEASELAGCGPLSIATIEHTAAVTALQPVDSPTICSWVGISASAGGGIVDISYAWFQKNSLMFDRQTAASLGYQTENLVTESFGGFYWHDPRDPGSCGASAADSGTVTWWIRDRDQHTPPDPCAAAWKLIQETVKLDG
ncbi:DUF3558 family protein [Nocardia sp. R7R-8]|uniref:DUF3558 family protein n=1 Tax=Nocardia sp. R7R-8 TaxID=3459304 RepID=UPI00403E154D